jgi:hypothetical protein
MVVSLGYDKSVFINCPFDQDYKPLFEAIVFTVSDCGFQARCALEIEDGGQVRMEKIFHLIANSKLGINDLCRVDLDSATNLPRFNMPLELGIFLGAQRFGQRRQKEKRCLILDRELYRYRAFISDIAGQDIQEHGNEPTRAIRVVRDWLRSQTKDSGMPGWRSIADRYEAFRADLHELCKEPKLDEEDLIWVEYTGLVWTWLRRNA